MSQLLEWVKPSGAIVKIGNNPDNIAAAKSLGWRPVSETSDSNESIDIELDARGLPWDERLNVRSRKKDSDGNWKYKRGVTTEQAQAVENELFLAMIDGG